MTHVWPVAAQHHALAWLAIGMIASFTTSRARANPRPLPFSYNYDTLEHEEVVLEQSVDARSPIVLDGDKHKTWDPQFRLQFEYAYGITDRFELGVAMVLASDPGKAVFFEGTKQRLHTRIGEQGSWPIDVGFNLELVEFRSAFAFEERLVLHKRWHHCQLIANSSLSEELEHYRSSVSWIVDQTVGGVIEVGSHVRLGVEYWMRVGVARREGEGEGQADEGGALAQKQGALETDREVVTPDPDVGFQTLHFLGPTLSFHWHRFWWSTAAYVRVDRAGQVLEIQAARNAPDPYGRVWVRSLIGLML